MKAGFRVSDSGFDLLPSLRIVIFPKWRSVEVYFEFINISFFATVKI